MGESKTPRHPPPPSENVDSRQRALDELKRPEESYTSDTAPSTAVVRTQPILAKDPVFYRGLQLGLTVQPYSAEGRVPLVSLGERDLTGASPTWMPGLEARFLPWTSHLLGEHGVGFRLGAAYTRQEISLYARTGVKLANTELHALETYAFLSQQWRLAGAKYWSVNADLGAMRFDTLLTSTSTLGEASDNIWLGVLRLGPAYRSGPFSFSLAYERREKVSAGWARLAGDGVVAGVMYDLR